MGQKITYEVGLLNIGRQIKTFDHGSNQHGAPATLTEVFRTHAMVTPHGHKSAVRKEWDDIRDWTSRNENPLKMPSPGTPALKATPIRPVAAPVVVAPPAPPVSPFALYSNLGPELEHASNEVAAAEDLVDQSLEQYQAAKVEHENAVSKLRRLREQAANALKEIDMKLVGVAGVVRQ